MITNYELQQFYISEYSIYLLLVNMSSAANMTIAEHLGELRSRVLRTVISILVLSLFTITFGLKPLEFHGQVLFYYPFPDLFHNISVQITSYMRDTLLPSEVKLIQTAPGQAFFAQVYVSLLIAIIGSIPIIVKEIFGFISPAIENKHTKNKIKVINIFLPMVSLFIAGIVFSYSIVIPFTLTFLYKYGQSLGVATFLNINDFISFVLQFFLAFGIAFELPVIMYALALAGLIGAKFWRNNLRYAAFILVIFGALVTPDGSGVTMWFVAGPMIVLYVIGMLAIERRERRNMTVIP
jgi:sec-independent protein translocase protein TatC